MCPKNLLHQERSGRFQLCLKGLRGCGFPKLTTWLSIRKAQARCNGGDSEENGKRKEKEKLV